MEQKEGIYTLGRMRYECILIGRQYLHSQGQPYNYMHLRIINNRYYDTLEDNSEAQADLKVKWDELAWKYKKENDEWKVRYDAADSLTKHDLVDEKYMIKFRYEMDRFAEVEHNYYGHKTYWDL